MSEPLRTEPSPGRDVPIDPAAQIERLLLAGLDLYFAGQYQDAINIWTRVVFLERGHGRARAYIERARAAIAEQQRESDELFHRGRAAYQQGELEQARQLLTRAIERGGSSDEALLLLQQLNRFTGLPARQPLTPARHNVAGAADARLASRGWVWLAGTVALVSALALMAAPLYSWFIEGPAAQRAATLTAPPEPLPIPRTGEEALHGARQLYAGGHLADALRTLERIDIGDPVRPEAERLKGDIQRDLLAMVRQSQQGPIKGAERR